MNRPITKISSVRTQLDRWFTTKPQYSSTRYRRILYFVFAADIFLRVMQEFGKRYPERLRTGWPFLLVASLVIGLLIYHIGMSVPYLLFSRTIKKQDDYYEWRMIPIFIVAAILSLGITVIGSFMSKHLFWPQNALLCGLPALWFGYYIFFILKSRTAQSVIKFLLYAFLALILI